MRVERKICEDRSISRHATDVHPVPLEQQCESDEDEEDRGSSEDLIDVVNDSLDDEPQYLEELFSDEDEFDNDENIGSPLANLGDEQLLRVYTILQGWMSKADVTRLSIAFDDPLLRKNVEKIKRHWRPQVLNVCGACGDDLNENHNCGETIRMQWLIGKGAEQLVNVFARNKSAIKQIWEAVRRGLKADSPASEGRLRQLLVDEEKDAIHLCLSADGIKISGTKQKIWPVTCSILDLDRKRRMRMDNIIFFGILIGDKDPKGYLFNRIIQLILQELKKFKELTGMEAMLTHVTADKPAQSALFNFAAHNSALSCSYCLTTETSVKKTNGTSRRMRGVQTSRNEATNGTYIDDFLSFDSLTTQLRYAFQRLGDDIRTSTKRQLKRSSNLDQSAPPGKRSALSNKKTSGDGGGFSSESDSC